MKATAWTLLVAVAAALGLAAGVRWYSSMTPPSASFAFENDVFTQLSPEVVAAIGTPLTPGEVDVIKSTSRAELERAFSGLAIELTDRGRGYWRVLVMTTVSVHSVNGRAKQNAAGASYPFGILGGGALLNFNTLALKAALYAPPGSSRDTLVRAIGRGIGRSAVHELAHLIAGAAPIHSEDENSYEFPSADRASQYYGELRWSVARPVLLRRLGST